jgi:hypothetical protein
MIHTNIAYLLLLGLILLKTIWLFTCACGCGLIALICCVSLLDKLINKHVSAFKLHEISYSPVSI